MSNNIKMGLFLTILIINLSLGSYLFSAVYGEYLFQLINFFFVFSFFVFVYFEKFYFFSFNSVELKRFFIVFLIVFFIVLSWFLNGADNGVGYFLSVLSPFLLFLSLTALEYSLPENERVMLAYRVLIIVTVFLSIEAVLRFSSPELLAAYIAGAKYESLSNMQSSGEGGFYIYKILSFLRFDSNGVGVIAFLAFSLSLFLSIKTKIKKHKIISLCLFILVVLTFSRAAILVSMLMLFSFFSIRIVIFSILISTLAFSWAYGFFVYGGSLESKFEVYNNLVNYISSADMFDLLIGKGLSSDIFDTYNTGAEGFFGHWMIVFLIYHVGFISALLYCLLIIPMRMSFRLYVFIFLFFVLGFSYLRPFEPFVFILLPMIYMCSNNKRVVHGF
ncbi:hypothetical protein [Pseudoalteromonas sp.]|uniref:hypothetical protein n=1 Tax=Pseudoalteromonas sp. TaxID=53249 RepID=UPI0035121F09